MSKIGRIRIPIVIFLSLSFAFLPAIMAHNYLRQDDLMWEIWPGMKITDFGLLYYNTVWQLFRPICMLSFYITDLLSFDIYHAVYVRLFSIIMMGTLGILLYYWQLLFNPNRFLACTFAIAAFTLPGYQVFVATGNYSLILTSLLLTFGALFTWHHGCQSAQKKWLWVGNILFFLSLLDYPLSSMFAWTALAIYYINMLAKTSNQFKILTHGLFKTIALRMIAVMAFYYVLTRAIHFIFKVKLDTTRVAVINTHDFGNRMMQIFDVLGWHANLWFWREANTLLASPIWIIIALTLIALTIIFTRKSADLITLCKQNLLTLSVLGLLFFLSYAPILATPDIVMTYRYTLATMPLLLYLIFFSVVVIIDFIQQKKSWLKLYKLAQMSFIIVVAFSIANAHMQLADGIVGPHEKDFADWQQQLQTRVLPYLRNDKKVLIHAIACHQDDLQSRQTNWYGFEYGMRTCQYQQQIIGVIVHSLNQMGYPSNEHARNTVIYRDNEIIVKDTPWGTLVVSKPNTEISDLTTLANNRPIITIDTREMVPYQRGDFHKHFFNGP